jgi:hypothetical protein
MVRKDNSYCLQVRNISGDEYSADTKKTPLITFMKGEE